MASLALLLTFAIAFIGVCAYLRCRVPQQELAKARAIIKDTSPPVSTTAPQTPTADPSHEERIQALLTTLDASEITDLDRGLLDRMNPSPPWFDANTTKWLCESLDLLRLQNRITPRDEARDPRTHSLDDIRAAVCAAVRSSETLKELRKAGRAANSDSAQSSPASGAAASTMRLCLKCTLTDGDPEAAAMTLIDAYWMSSHADYRDHACRVLDWQLPDTLDLFPGAVPDPIARELLACLDTPLALDPQKRAIRVRAARTVTADMDQRTEAIANAWNNDRILTFVTPNRYNPLYTLVETSPCAQALDRVDRALPLLDSPPYLVADRFRALLDSVPSSATNTKDFVIAVQSLSADHYGHLALAAVARSVIALKQYKAANGKYPATLEALAPNPIPALPTDPITGQPLRYATEGDGFAITPSTNSDGTRRLPKWQLINWHAER